MPTGFLSQSHYSRNLYTGILLRLLLHLYFLDIALNFIFVIMLNICNVPGFIIITGVLIIARIFGESAGWRTSLAFSILGVIMFTAAAAIIFYGTCILLTIRFHIIPTPKLGLCVSRSVSPSISLNHSLLCHSTETSFFLFAKSKHQIVHVEISNLTQTRKNYFH